jgi:hypothetical protein
MGIIKTVGSSGQISLGKKLAGQTVMIDEIQAGVWIIKLGKFIPNSEKWLYGPNVQTELNEAISWAEETSPEDTNFEQIEARIKR